MFLCPLVSSLWRFADKSKAGIVATLIITVALVIVTTCLRSAVDSLNLGAVGPLDWAVAGLIALGLVITAGEFSFIGLTPVGTSHRLGGNVSLYESICLAVCGLRVVLAGEKGVLGFVGWVLGFVGWVPGFVGGVVVRAVQEAVEEGFYGVVWRVLDQMARRGSVDFVLRFGGCLC